MLQAIPSPPGYLTMRGSHTSWKTHRRLVRGFYHEDETVIRSFFKCARSVVSKIDFCGGRVPNAEQWKKIREACKTLRELLDKIEDRKEKLAETNKSKAYRQGRLKDAAGKREAGKGGKKGRK